MRPSLISCKYAQERMSNDVERHTSMLNCFERSLKDRDACVEREVRIPTQEVIRQPDLMAYVIDRQVVADHVDFN